MAQFDVHESRGRNRSSIPYVVNVQSRRYDRLASRVVIPLMVARGALGSIELSLMPGFEIGGQTVFLNPLETQTVRLSGLGPVVASLSDDISSMRIIAAIDLVITHAYG